MSKARELADVIGTQDTTENVLQGRRNLIINGGFQVSQRGDYSSATSATNGSFYIDRWRSWIDSVTADVQNTTVTINGVTKKALRYTATSSGTGYIGAYTRLETQDLPVGETLTFSCWMRSNNSNARLRSDVQSAANSPQAHTGGGDWEYITWTQTATGTTNPYLGFITYAGSTVAITSGDYIEVADFQLEVGSVATPFEHRSYSEELALCQRYYSKITSVDCSAYCGPGISPTFNFVFPQTMRATPTITISRQSGDDYNLVSITQRNQTPDSFNLYLAATSSNVMAAFGHNGQEATLIMDAEL